MAQEETTMRSTEKRRGEEKNRATYRHDKEGSGLVVAVGMKSFSRQICRYGAPDYSRAKLASKILKDDQR
jgi:hypothetical protein